MLEEKKTRSSAIETIGENPQFVGKGMKLIREVSNPEIHHAWLKSEWFRISHQYPDVDRGILDSPNFEDEKENELRKRLLAHRGPILDPLPPDIIWHAVNVGQSDVEKLYIIPIFDWFLDTGRTFSLVGTLEHLAPNRGYYNQSREVCTIDHFNEVSRKLSFWGCYKEAQANERLILVATETKGPFTIIDGTHRAVAYLKKEKDALSVFPWKGYLGISPNCRTYRWHVESDEAKQHIKLCKIDASRDLLW